MARHPVPAPRPEEEAFLQAIVESGGEESLYLILADWLEENDDPRRGELLRLHRRLIATCCEPDKHPERVQWQARIVALLAEGVQPSVPRVEVAGMRFAWCSPGEFLMGSPANEAKRDRDEAPHRVTVAKGFWMGVTPVTQAQWMKLIRDNPSAFEAMDRPVERVSWDDCMAFCAKLGERTGKQFRLPTEAEWEYACRAGSTTPYHFGETISTEQANFHDFHRDDREPIGVNHGLTTAVGRFPANAWGLYDMHGNVWEWCADAYGPYPTDHSQERDAIQDEGRRVVRGGAWNREASRCRSACRASDAPDHRHENIGCRLVLSRS